MPRQGAGPIAGATANFGRIMTPWLWLVLVVVLFAGGLFGYDQGVISGALRGIKSTFTLSPLLIEVVTSWVTLGALFGALAGGELADRIGRKRTVLIAGAHVHVGRRSCKRLRPTRRPGRRAALVGAGVGVAAVAAPLYAAELAPAAVRGRFVSSYQLAITIGIFLAYLVDGWLSPTATWRMMLGASAVPGLLLFAVALAAPESPRWLMMMGRRADAAAELRKISPGVDVEAALDAIATALRQEGQRASWGEVFHQRMASPADDRRRARGLPADHRHQRDHLLCRSDFRLRRLRHAGRADHGHHLGDRRRQRARHPDRHRLHRSPGAAEAAARRA